MTDQKRDESRDVALWKTLRTPDRDGELYTVHAWRNELSEHWSRYVPYDQYAALEAENEKLREQLTTEGTVAKTLTHAVVCAEDYISCFEDENDITKQEYLYIRDAAKCLRETGCV